MPLARPAHPVTPPPRYPITARRPSPASPRAARGSTSRGKSAGSTRAQSTSPRAHRRGRAPSSSQAARSSAHTWPPPDQPRKVRIGQQVLTNQHKQRIVNHVISQHEPRTHIAASCGDDLCVICMSHAHKHARARASGDHRHSGAAAPAARRRTHPPHLRQRGLKPTGALQHAVDVRRQLPPPRTHALERETRALARR